MNQNLQSNLDSISPIDGRYRQSLHHLQQYFSEAALMKYRVFVEIEYLIFLTKHHVIKQLSTGEQERIKKIYVSFDSQKAQQIKTLETKTNHDIKAVEYFLQSELQKMKLSYYSPFIHIGLTSDDTNNLAYGLILKRFKENILSPQLKIVLTQLRQLSLKYKKSALLGRTHGQPAVPTTVGKELANFYFRLEKQQKKLDSFRFEGKLTGAVGNLNALQFVLPKFNWLRISKEFVSQLGLSANMHTTQIIPADNYLEFFQILALINGIMINLCQDMWIYIMLEEFKLKKKEGEVGSSTMPQKVNPIHFENSEGNAGIANSYFKFYQDKLIVSRLQRDLSDSTVKRTFGTALAHTLLAWQSLDTGLSRIEFDGDAAQLHLQNHYEILGEVLQVYLRSKGMDGAYEKVKHEMRGKKLDKKDFKNIIKKLGIPDLIDLSPEKYLGYAEELAEF